MWMKYKVNWFFYQYSSVMDFAQRDIRATGSSTQSEPSATFDVGHHMREMRMQMVKIMIGAVVQTGRPAAVRYR